MRLLRHTILMSAFLAGMISTALAQTYRDGLDAFRSGDAVGAYEIWKPLAEAGDPSAQFGLAVLYEKGGGGFEQNLDEAIKWYELAAGQGIAAAQNNLGHMYSQGMGVTKDKARAVKLWLAAAEGGHVLSYYNLGLAYYRGDGVAKNESEAARWFAKAADAGLADGQFAMGEMHRLGIGMKKDEAQALGWYKLAAGQGHPMGQRLVKVLEDQGVTTAPTGAADIAAPSQERTAAPAAATPEPPASPTTDTVTQGARAEQLPAVITGRPRPASRQTAATSPSEPTADPATPSADPEPRAAATAVPSAPAAQRPAAAASPRGIHIWLASMKSYDDARGHWKLVQDKHGQLFKDLPPLFIEVDLGERGTYHRVMVGPLDNREFARQLCDRMRSDDPRAFCKVLVR